MQEVLRTSRGFATVSSTAALEAMAMNRPTLIISDFGVSAEMINLAFQESGCLGTLDDLRSGRLRQADPEWREANHCHPAGITTGWICSKATGGTCCRTVGSAASLERLTAGAGAGVFA
jgi:hypothetical protein